MPKANVQPATQSAQQRMPHLIADPRDYLVSAQPIANALNQVAANAMQAAGILERKKALATSEKQKQQQITDVTWTSESSSQLKREMTKWMKENQASETFDEDFLRTFKKSVDDYAQNAPSDNAALRFKMEMGTWGDTRYGQAADITADTKLNNTLESFNRQSINLFEQYRESRDVKGASPVEDITGGLESLHNSIDEAFGDISPKLANNLKAKYAADTVTTVMADNPELAQYILDQTPEIEATQRARFQEAIDSRKESRNVEEQIAFTNQREDAVMLAQVNGERGKLPLEEYQKFYSSDRAKTLKAQDDYQIDLYSNAKSLLEGLSQFNAATQINGATSLLDGAETKQDREAAELVAKEVQRNLKMQNEDPVSWLREFNKDIKSYHEQLEIANSDEENVAIRTRLNDTLLWYQGMPGPDDKELENKFLNRPSDDLHLLSPIEATDIAARINGTPPSQVVDTFKEIMGMYPKRDHAMIVLNDLVTLPSKENAIRPEYQLAFLNLNQPGWLQEYVGAISNAESLKRLSPESKNDIDSAIRRNPLWKQFSGAMGGDNSERADEQAAFMDGVAAYAQSMIVNGGKSVKSAVNLATSRLIGSNLGFTYINGQSLMVTRERIDPEAPPRSNEDVAEIGRKLSVALSYIDPRKVNAAVHMPATELLSPIQKAQEVRNVITQRGFFRSLPDGQGVTLYAVSDQGSAYQVQGTDGKPFTIYYDDLPEFEETTEYPMPIGPGAPMFIEGRPPMKTGRKRYAMDTYDIQVGNKTNWPVAVDWIK